MRRWERQTESERLEKRAQSAQRRGNPAEAARLRKAAAREAERELAQKEDAKKNAPSHHAYFMRRYYEKLTELDAEYGTNTAAPYACYANAPYAPPPPSDRSPEETEALRQQMKDKLDAIIAGLEREAEEGTEESDVDPQAAPPPSAS
jgi:hypothetical protein